MTVAPAPLTVIVVDDHVVVRRGIIAFLEVLPDITAVGEAGNGAEALELLEGSPATTPCPTSRSSTS